MSAVFKLVTKSDNENVELLRKLLKKAEAGEVFDIRIGYHDHQGREILEFTGRYKEDRKQVVVAAFRTVLSFVGE